MLDWLFNLANISFSEHPPSVNVMIASEEIEANPPKLQLLKTSLANNDSTNMSFLIDLEIKDGSNQHILESPNVTVSCNQVT